MAPAARAAATSSTTTPQPPGQSCSRWMPSGFSISWEAEQTCRSPRAAPPSRGANAKLTRPPAQKHERHDDKFIQDHLPRILAAHALLGLAAKSHRQVARDHGPRAKMTSPAGGAEENKEIQEPRQRTPRARRRQLHAHRPERGGADHEARRQHARPARFRQFHAKQAAPIDSPMIVILSGAKNQKRYTPRSWGWILRSAQNDRAVCL